MYAGVVIDIPHKNVDRLFTYRVPQALEKSLKAGDSVLVPFGKGNKLRNAYVVSLSEKTGYPEEGLKEIDSIKEKDYSIEERMLRLAIWMRDRYGGTLDQALRLTVPTRTEVTPRDERFYVFTKDREELETMLAVAEKKKHYARIRLFTAFLDNNELPAGLVSDRLNIGSSTLKSLIGSGHVRVISKKNRNSLAGPALADGLAKGPELNEEQANAVRGILGADRPVSILHGITGSGKTEVYLRLIEEVLREGKEVIVLIPEIALTFQTVMRFYARFGDLVSVVHSRVSKGEKCERFELAKNGEVRVMIGPRSALFTPFQKLGMIIIDEFHESSYISEQTPRYHAVETAIRRAADFDAKVVLGSATPDVSCYYQAMNGEFGLFELHERAVPGSELPKVTVVDLREELKKGNRTIFSEVLQEKIRERLKKNEQVMLFLNRRGYAGSVSCRSCGKPVECPHCSVSLHYHNNHRLKCHICGYEMPMVDACPTCGSSLIGRFGTGTQKVEEAVQELFPGVRTLRMDADTTSGKNGHQEIIEKFMNHDADVLIGTQMIVKGHDFKNVTLMGILAADLSLNVPDYRASERTFQLLTQAEGRAGRAGIAGECIVQTYVPEHYAVRTAAEQDFKAFYEEEMVFRKQLMYPPAGFFMMLMVSGADRTGVHGTIGAITEEALPRLPAGVRILGPTDADIYRVKDMYREMLYFKAGDEETLLRAKRVFEEITETVSDGKRYYISFEEP
ncbi:MAG: primosomal protein N' [Lachnospiraceae bacterium]|nr:primosomal protein N' [Lachnospiraceae bacterium]